MLQASVSGTYMAVSILVGFLTLVVIGGGAYGLTKLLKGQSVRQIAETAAAQISSMKDFSDTQALKIEALEKESESKTQHITALEGQVSLLRDLVTQAAKVDQLRKESTDHHTAIMADLTTIKKAVVSNGKQPGG